MPKKISDLKQDPKNFNKGTLTGDALLKKSISKFGFRGAVTIDKNGVIIGGNKRTAKAGELGFEDLEVIEADSNKVYALQYSDIDLSKKKGKELALALNKTAQENIFIDIELVEIELPDVCEDWGVEKVNTGTSQNEDNSEDGTESYFTENKYPLSIVLNKAQALKWNGIKENMNLIQDTNAFIKIIENLSV